MQRSPATPVSPAAAGSPVKPLSTVKLFTKEHVLQEWQSAIIALAQRETEMISMSNEFAEYINSVRDQMDAMLQANHTMLEESRRRGLHLKKLEAFFAEFPFPYSLRQPVATAFLSVGIQMPWWTGRSEPQQLMPNFSDTDISDAEDLCARLRSVLEIKDELTQKLLDSQARHEEEMESFVLYHKKSIATAQHNAMLSVSNWTVERLTLQSKIQEKEAEIKIVNQELQLLKQGMEKLRGQTNWSVPQTQLLEHLSRKKDANKMFEISRSPVPLMNGEHAAFSPRMRESKVSQQSKFDIMPVFQSYVQQKGVGLTQQHSDHFRCEPQQNDHSFNTPREEQPTSAMRSPSLIQSLAVQQQRQYSELQSVTSPLTPVASMQNGVRGLKGTKICSEFRGYRAVRFLDGPSSTRAVTDAGQLQDVADFGKDFAAELRTTPRIDGHMRDSL